MVRPAEVELRPGDTLVLYTDGVTEAANRSGEQLGLDRLATIVKENAGQTAERMIQAIWRGVNAFTDGIQPVDDTTFVVCRVL